MRRRRLFSSGARAYACGLLRKALPGLLAALSLTACHKAEEHPSLPPGSLGAGLVDLNAVADDDPSFVNIPPVEALLEEDSSTGTFGDLDGDGQMEFVSGFGQVFARTYDISTRSFRPQRPIPLAEQTFQSVMAVLDLDGDGHLDLISGKGFHVAWGQGDGSFVVAPLLRDAPGLVNGALSLALADVDSDGWLDLVAGTRGGRKNLVILNRVGLREWQARSEWMPDTSTGDAYAVLANQLRPGELFIGMFGGCGVNCSHPYPPTFFHQLPDTTAGDPLFADFNPLPLNAYYRTAEYKNEPLTITTPMGGTFGDIDGDGRIDLMVSTDNVHAFFQGQDDWPMRDRTMDTGIVRIEPDPKRRGMIPWGAALVDLDGDGRLDLLTAHGKDSEEAFWLGPQRITAHFGRDDFHFIDGSEAAQLSLNSHWHTLALGDLDGDGDADVAAGRLGLPPHVFRNDIDTGQHRITLKLQGTASNHLAAGARVWVRSQPQERERLILPDGIGSPEVLSDPMAFIGLGEATSADRVRIEWPSGYVQELHDLPSGQRYDVTEPRLIDITPASRHLAADGLQRAVIAVTPYDAPGAVLAGASVQIRLEGAGADAAPQVAAQDDGTWRVEVGPVQQAGQTVVHVIINGNELRVHPRLWWDDVTAP